MINVEVFSSISCAEERQRQWTRRGTVYVRQATVRRSQVAVFSYLQYHTPLQDEDSWLVQPQGINTVGKIMGLDW